MACNGYNHPLDCNCGWGGVFYPTADGFTYGPGFWSREGSYFNPNAKCPVCGSAVFFYRSPDNGRVFFDHPGPPWPKHPCTSRNEPKPTQASSDLDPREGWFPFPCKAILEKNEQITELINTQDRSLYIHHYAGKLDLESPFWLRQIETQTKRYELSLLTLVRGVMQPTRLPAFVNLQDLIESLGLSLIYDPSSDDRAMDQKRIVQASATSINPRVLNRGSRQVENRPKPVLKFQEQKSRKDLSKVMKTIEERQDQSAMAKAFGRLAKKEGELSQLVQGLKQKK